MVVANKEAVDVFVVDGISMEREVVVDDDGEDSFKLDDMSRLRLRLKSKRLAGSLRNEPPVNDTPPVNEAVDELVKDNNEDVDELSVFND